MFLKQLSKKQIATKFGQREKYLVMDEGGKLYDSWVAEWNKNWVEGQTIDIKAEQIESREWQGKTYMTLKPPFAQGAKNTIANDLLAKIDERTNEILQIVRRLEEKNNF